MKKNFTYSIVVLVASLLVIGCSELKEEKIPTQTVVSIHGDGFTNPSSANFHAKYIQSKNFDITTCRQCHGLTYDGGTANTSCNTCHNKQDGPENCTTCHGSVNAAPPKDLADNTSPTVRSVGAHQKHILGGLLGAPVACKECHAVPTKLYDAGHIDNTQFAEVRFDSTSAMFRSNAVYSAANVSCTNTYCHGNRNGGNLNVTMTWTDTTAAATACGTCHGDVTKTTLAEKAFPQSGHPAIGSYTCVQCHGSVINASMAIINPSKHMNGKID
ncbi:MAG: cytochrome c3 family protein [Bacteroidota bacterium]